MCGSLSGRTPSCRCGESQESICPDREPPLKLCLALLQSPALQLVGLVLRRVLLGGPSQVLLLEKTTRLEVSPQHSFPLLAEFQRFERQRMDEQHLVGMLRSRGPQAQQQYFIPLVVVENGKRSQHLIFHQQHLTICSPWQFLAISLNSCF